MYLEPRAAVAAAAVSILTAFAGVAGVNAAWIVLAVLDGALIAAVIADVTTAPAPAALRPGRQGSETLTIGEAASSVVHVSNPTSRPLHITVRDAAPPSLRM